ncbi:hypothetical protein GUJ93_ZPchr0198g38 [Zizania palustris]|uniref:BZIP domain-containing protein n=1 Tax=Zizania palustris TaxID=103762 RepID=A0A8J5TGX0_ZIZPA|nr:hypothetical protein GUJ93_ZPchr0198g38 [Zizania palustris]
MERVFPVEETTDPLWAPPSPPLPQAADGVGVVSVDGVCSGGAMLERCSSGLSLEKFLEEELLDGVPAQPAWNTNGPVLYPSPMAAEAGGSRGHDSETVEAIPAPAPAPAPPPLPVSAVLDLDPMEYNAMLKRKLDEDLAAVAMWRASGALRSESSLGNETSPNTVGSSLSSQKCVGGNGILMLNKFSPGPTRGSGPSVVQNIDAHGKQATNSSSREPSPSPSDDDDMDGEAEAMGNMILDEDKVKKRKESNRESARRSRCRKAARLKDLEDQVAILRVENSSLLRRLADSNQKYSAATINNRVLIAEIEALRSKVRMAEDNVKKVTGTRQLPRVIPDMSTLNNPFSVSRSNATSHASVPIQNNHPMSYYTTPTNASVNGYMPEVSPTFQIADSTGNTDQTDSQQLQHMANLQHLQNGVFGGVTSTGYVPWGSPLLDPNELVNMELQ